MSIPTGGRRLFVYWRVAPVRLGAAQDAVSAWHRGLQDRWPGSRMTLWVRQEPARTTVMEIHEHPDGVDAPLEQAVREEGDAATQAFRDGGRHVEVFSPLA